MCFFRKHCGSCDLVRGLEVRSRGSPSLLCPPPSPTFPSPSLHKHQITNRKLKGAGSVIFGGWACPSSEECWEHLLGYGCCLGFQGKHSVSQHHGQRRAPEAFRSSQGPLLTWVTAVGSPRTRNVLLGFVVTRLRVSETPKPGPASRGALLLPLGKKSVSLEAVSADAGPSTRFPCLPGLVCF